MRAKRIFLTDLILIPLFVLTFYTGIELHIAGHGMNHYLWHNWAIFHTVVSLFFTIVGIIHISMHWGWYKRVRKKSKITLGLSYAFIIVLTTGALLLFCVDGNNSLIGLWHYIIGLIIGVLGAIHFLKRIFIFYKGVKLAFIKKSSI